MGAAKRTLTLAALAVFALSCSERPNRQVVGPPRDLAPRASATHPANGPGACMFDDAVSAGYSQAKLQCTANDVDISQAEITLYSINNRAGPYTALLAGQKISCTPGDIVYAVTDALIQNSANERYDLGLWIDTTATHNANTGSTCLHYNLVPGQGGSTEIDQTADQCGDMTSVKNLHL